MTHKQSIYNYRRPGLMTTELANTATHAAGLFLSIIGLCVLVYFALRYGTRLHLLAISIYGTTLVILYLASTLYHALAWSRFRRALRVLDHSAIFLLIAGTYTPFTLVTLEGSFGWMLFGMIWGIALVGVLLKVFYIGRMKAFSIGLYLLMGWLVLFAMYPLVQRMPIEGIFWMFLGGAFYTTGVFFYINDKLPHHHAIWHIMVMLGSACHYYSVMCFVLPMPWLK